MEKAKFDPTLPKYYRGYDLDELWEKSQNEEEMTIEEQTALCTIIEDTYDEQKRKEQKEKVKQTVIDIRNGKRPFIMKSIDPFWIPEGKTAADVITEIQKKEYDEFCELYKELKEEGEL